VNEEKDTPGSGSRWEPGAVPEPAAPATATPAAAQTSAAAEAPTAEVPYQAPAAELPAFGMPPGAGVPPVGRRGLRGRVALAGVGAALAVAGGVGGFALGYAAAGNEVDEASMVQGTGPGHDVGGDDGDGFPGRPDFGDRGTRPDFGGAVPGDPDGDGSGTGSDGSAGAGSGSDDSSRDGTT
jgi:hypothetical protein